MISPGERGLSLSWMEKRKQKVSPEFSDWEPPPSPAERGGGKKEGWKSTTRLSVSPSSPSPAGRPRQALPSLFLSLLIWKMGWQESPSFMGPCEKTRHTGEQAMVLAHITCSCCYRSLWCLMSQTF